MARNIRKLLQRRFYTFLNTNHGFITVFLCFFVIFKSILNLFIGNTCVHTAHSNMFYHIFAIKPIYCSEKSYRDNIGSVDMEQYLSYEPIDIVYTWVNGSDPIWMLKKNMFLHKDDPILSVNGNNTNNTESNTTDVPLETDSNRYRDSNELKYSLRSIEKNAPWVRHVYIVTDNQIPHWLNLESDRLTMVSHSEIFQNKSHLPVFSSPAIESHLHDIPGISKKFIYFNDDVFLGTTVSPEDFVSISGVQKFIMSWDVPKCAPGCAESWIGDGYCDKSCNVSACNFDFPDCVGGGKNNHHGSSSGSRSPTTPIQCSQGCPDSWLADKVCDNKCKTLECGFDMGDCGISLIKENYPGVLLQPYIPVSTASYDTLYDSEIHPISTSGAVYVHAQVSNSTSTYMIFPHEATAEVGENDEAATVTPPGVYVSSSTSGGLVVELDLSNTNTTNNTSTNSSNGATTPETIPPTNRISPVVLRVPYGSANVVYFNLSLLACVSHMMQLDPLGDALHPDGVSGNGSSTNNSDLGLDVQASVLSGYYPNMNGTGGNIGDSGVEWQSVSGPVGSDDDSISDGNGDGDFSSGLNSKYPFQELDFKYVESMCNLTKIRANLASGGDGFVYTHAEYDVEGVVHFASILSQHHTLAVILYHREYPSNSHNSHGPMIIEPPSSYPYDTTITVSGYNKRYNVNVSTSFVLRVEEPIDTEIPMRSKWYSKQEKWYFRMPIPLESISSATPGLAPTSGSPMKPIHGFSSACFESDPLNSHGVENSKMRIIDTVSLLKKPYVYKSAAAVGNVKNVEGIVLALNMWSATTFRARLNEVLDREDNAEVEIGMSRQLQGIEEIVGNTAISDLSVEYTVTSGNGEHSSFSVPLLQLLGFINKRGIVMTLPKGTGTAPKTLSDAVTYTKELHAQYSSTRRWQGTTPHSDPLTKPAVKGLASRLLSSPDAATETNPHDVLLMILPLPIFSADTPLGSWLHIQWDITAPVGDVSPGDVGNSPMNSTTTTETANSTLFSSLRSTRSYGCGVVSFEWGSLTPLPNNTQTFEEYLPYSTDISLENNFSSSAINNTSAHVHSISIADTTAVEVDGNINDASRKQNSSTATQDAQPEIEAVSEVVSNVVSNIDAGEITEDHSGGTIRARRKLQTEASNLRGLAPAMQSTVTNIDFSWIAHIVPEYLRSEEPESNIRPQGDGGSTEPVDIMVLLEKFVQMYGAEGDTSVDDLGIDTAVELSVSSSISPSTLFLNRRQHRRRLVDTYAQSLIHVNRLYSKAFGSENRKVPAHVPHVIDTDIMREMQHKWSNEWNATSSHRFRSSTDMQYSFSYYYYTMNRQKLAKVDVLSYLSHQVDTNNNNVVDDNEFRSLVAILKGGKVPVREADIAYYKNNCSLNSASLDFVGLEEVGDTIVKDEHGVLKVGSITREFFPTIQDLASCPAVIEGIKEYAAWYTPNPTYILGSENDVAFEMIGDNATDTLSQLDSVRARQSKFICINDNIHNLSDELAEIVMDFFEAMFPIASQFELLHGHRNPTLYTDEYRSIRNKAILGVNIIDAQRFLHGFSRWCWAIRRQWTRYVQSMALKVLSFTYSGAMDSDSRKRSGNSNSRNVYVHYEEGRQRNHRRLFEMSSRSSSEVGGEEEMEIVFTGEFRTTAIVTVLVIIAALALTYGCRHHLTKQKVKKLEKLHSEEGSTFKVMKSKKVEDEAETEESSNASTGTGPASGGEIRARRGSFYDDKMTASLSDFNKASPPPHGDPLNDLWRAQTQNTADVGNLNGDPLNDIWAKAGYGTSAAPDTNVIYECRESYVNNSNKKSILISRPNSSYCGNKNLSVKFDLYANTIDGEPVKRGLFAFAANALKARRNSSISKNS